MKKLILPLMFALMVLSFMFIVVALAAIVDASVEPVCEYHNHDGCNPVEYTIIEGKITYDNNDSNAGKASISVTCFHDGSEYTKNTNSAKSGLLKGTYIVTFPQSQCITGDTVRVTATKGDLTGVSEGTVVDYITRKCLDIDVAIVNVPLVPEFGTMVGVLTIIGALSVFFVVRKN